MSFPAKPLSVFALSSPVIVSFPALPVIFSILTSLSVIVVAVPNVSFITDTVPVFISAIILSATSFKPLT